MKILIVSWYFPPSNTIGANRLGHIARDLLASGHDVQVLTAANPPYSQTMDLVFPPERVHASPWTDINDAPTRAVHRIKRLWRTPPAVSEADTAEPSHDPAGAAAIGAAGQKGKALRESLASRLWRTWANFPDSQVGWMPDAVRHGKSLMRDWHPDIMLASGPPHTTLIVGRRLAGCANVPLVVELRDRWWDDPYYPPPWLRRQMEKRAETWVINGAVGISTVSEPWAEAYRTRYNKPVVTVYNGYNPASIGDDDAPGAAGSPTLEIGYFGGIYPGRRDPSPLFSALTTPAVAPLRIKVTFQGTRPDLVWPLVDKYGVRDVVTVLPEVPNSEALRLQRRKDVLLLMQWNSPLEQGNVPGKFFEYLASRRPILGLGPEDGVPATITKSRNAGTFRNDPDQIAAALVNWATTKRETGMIAPLPTSVRAGFSRPEQSALLENLLVKLGPNRAD